MSESSKPPMIAADYIRDLVKGYVTTDKIDRFVPVPNVGNCGAWDKVQERITTYHGPLLDQIEEATVQSKDGDFSGGSAKSKPAARLDALTTLHRIDRQSRNLSRRLSLPKAPLRERLLAIGGKLGLEDHREVHGWWIQARCVTGWEQPAYQPQVPCPNMDCERWSSLRIRIEEGIGSCIECGTTWKAADFKVLGEYIRWAAEHLTGSRHWLVGADGYPVECTECLAERQAMAERKVERAAKTAK